MIVDRRIVGRAKQQTEIVVLATLTLALPIFIDTIFDILLCYFVNFDTRLPACPACSPLDTHSRLL